MTCLTFETPNPRRAAPVTGVRSRARAGRVTGSAARGRRRAGPLGRGTRNQGACGGVLRRNSVK